MYKKEAVVKVLEEYFVLKSTIEQQKKDLVVLCKLSIFLAQARSLSFKINNNIQ
jgi:hypothetical protein